MENIITNANRENHYFQWKNVDLKISVFFDDHLLAESRRAILIKEVTPNQVYDGMYYFPKEHVDKSILSVAETHTHCPIKGDAGYYNYDGDGKQEANIAWFYIEPIRGSLVIQDYVAFAPDKVKMVIEP